MNNTLLDNSSDFRMVKYIKELLSDPQCTELKIATGYWDLQGTKLIYDELKAFFERGGKFDLLIGQEPMVRSYMLNNTSTSSQTFPDVYIERDVNRFCKDYQDVVHLLLEYMEPKPQLRVRVYGQGEVKQFLHAKCYIFLGSGCGFAHGIVGSSNFTQKGLEENAELNYLETDAMRVACPISPYIKSKSHLTWFEEKWQNSVPWTGKFIQILKGGISNPPIVPTPIPNIALTPYEVYIRLLQDCFGVDDNMDFTLKDYLSGTIYTAQPYQLDAVKQCYNIMLKMHGFLLADVVGLGKTVVGALVIRYYLEHIKKNNGLYNNVLVVVPPAILSGWKETIEELDNANKSFRMADYIDFVTTGSIASLIDEDVEDDNEQLSFQKKDYGLIVIDESHRFRNKGTQMYDSLDGLISEIRKNTGISPFIGLVSATPQNNRPEELQNQINFFVPTPKKSQFTRIPSCDLETYFAGVKKEFKNIDPIKDSKKLMNLSNDIREKILNDIIVRRTRTDIETTYPGSIKFPTTVGPNVLKYNMSSTLATLFSDTVDTIDPTPGATGIGYHRYSAIARLVSSAHKKRYEGRNMTVKSTSDRLAKIMKLLLIKRLESSFDAFKVSLENLSRYTQNMIDMWNDDHIFICPELDVNGIIANHTKRADAYKELRTKISSLPKTRNAKGQNAEYTQSDFDANYINDLVADKNLIDGLLKRWKKNTSDPKLDEFKAKLPCMMASDIQRLDDFIKQMLAYAKENPDKADEVYGVIEEMESLKVKLTQDKTKLVIFTEAIPTVDKIYGVATTLGYNVLKITAANRNAMRQTIQENFDANYKGQQKDDYDIIITTEVLAEGVNLHRANAILNYDSPWNATRLIQRIGRVNRIGSKSKAVFVYNFFPSTKGNDEIKLIENAYRKLQAFHTQFGEDDKVFNPREILSPAAFNTIVSGPASWQMKYMKELMDYKTNKPTRFKEIMTYAAPLRVAINANDIVAGPDSSANDVETLCAVKNTSAANSYYVAVDNAATSAYDVSMQFILDHCHCSENTPAISLPTNITDIEQKAIDQYYISLQARTKSSGKANKDVKEAKRILATIWAKDTRFDGIRSTLATARKLVDGGNKVVAKKIIDLEAQINSPQLSIPLTADDVTNIIDNAMKIVAASVAKNYGNNMIFITFNKQ